MTDPHVWIRCKHDPEHGAVFICGDEDGEFARAGTVEAITRYVEDLLCGPGTLASGPLWERCELGG